VANDGFLWLELNAPINNIHYIVSFL